MTELAVSTDLAASVQRLAAARERRDQADTEIATASNAIRALLPVGQRTRVGELTVTVTPNRRLDTEAAATLLPTDSLRDACRITTWDLNALKRLLPPALLDSCYVERGDPVVRLS